MERAHKETMEGRLKGEVQMKCEVVPGTKKSHLCEV